MGGCGGGGGGGGGGWLLGLGVSFFGNSRIPSDFCLGILDLA